jgi:hypothetical protein
MTISGIIVGVIMFFLLLAAGRRFGEPVLIIRVRAVALAVMVGIVTAFSPKVPTFLAMIFLLAMVAGVIYFVAWWSEEGSEIRELIIFGIIDGIWAASAESAAARILDMTEIGWVIGIVRAVPLIALLLSFGFFIFNMICWREEINSEEFDPDDYLNGDEKLEDFKNKDSIFRRIRRWCSYEEVC